MSVIAETAINESLGRYSKYDIANSDIQKLLAAKHELIIHRNPASSQLLLVFPGLINDGQGFQLMRVHQALSRFNTSIIYFRDLDIKAYLGGIGQMADSFEGTIQEIRKLQTILNAKRVLTFGTSAGGYASILYGVKLGAEKVISFGGATTISEEFFVNETRGAATCARLRKLYPYADLDFREVLMKLPNPPKIDLHYGELMDYDRRHAEYLAGIPCVTLHPLIGYEEHTVLRQLLVAGKMPQVLRDFFE